MKQRYIIGDRVRNVRTGECGVVCTPTYREWVGVRWDGASQERHDCDGHCDMFHGWKVMVDDIELWFKQEETPLEILNIENLFD